VEALELIRVSKLAPDWKAGQGSAISIDGADYGCPTNLLQFRANSKAQREHAINSGQSSLELVGIDT